VGCWNEADMDKSAKSFELPSELLMLFIVKVKAALSVFVTASAQAAVEASANIENARPFKVKFIFIKLFLKIFHQLLVKALLR